jgi:myo-inositol-1(or 4)-monophosphatase
MMQATLDTLGDFFRQNVHGMRRFGAAALDLCNLGCGHYGLFFEYKLHPWDYAAGQLLEDTAVSVQPTDCCINDLSRSFHRIGTS